VRVNSLGKHIFYFLAGAALFGATVTASVAQMNPDIQPDAQQLMALANQARAAAGAQPLRWDPPLAQAALKHTERMVAEGPIAHRYPGELELKERAGLAGAHFDLIEENIAIGPTPAAIHDAWMHSEGHRDNMLNPEVNRVGIAVVASRGVLYATADFSRAVQKLSDTQVEARVAALIAPRGVKILADHAIAREACEADRGLPRSATGSAEPSFVMRWQDSDLSRIPNKLIGELASGRYREAEVGSCSPEGDNGTFTAYRVAVLLY
jgi:hypothetical protein